ncbi:hypothetical protein CZ771_10915 [Actinomycetales bacterium JB111]|nr:hypothetical protein CZ771_10915 [Actinomycetales bacterium JB111]
MTAAPASRERGWSAHLGALALPPGRVPGPALPARVAGPRIGT